MHSYKKRSYEQFHVFSTFNPLAYLGQQEIGNSWKEPPHSPFFEEDQDENEKTHEKEIKQKFAREVQKKKINSDSVKYYNDWVMSNLGWNINPFKGLF